jgi:hypothetical protein
MGRIARATIALLAAWGVLLTVLLATERWSSGLWQQPALPAQHGHHGHKHHDRDLGADDGAGAAALEPAAPSKPSPGSAPPPTGAEPGAIVAARYAVCPREESPPALSRVRIADKGRDLWALHCGPSAHVLAIEDNGGVLGVRRALTAQLHSHNAGEAPRAVRITAGDLDGDGRADLLVPVQFIDRAGAPASGALSWLRQRAQGGFDAPPRALDAAVAGVTVATLDAQAGQDVALIQLGDARAARGSELWLLHGGPALLRYAKLPAGVGPSAIAAADLDRDGLDDVAVASEREGKLRLWLSSRAATGAAEPPAPAEIALEGVREAIAGDVDGDGARDLVLTGKQVWLLLARNDFRPEPAAVPDSADLRDVHLEDTNADGKLDLVGYAHPALIVLQQTGATRFERRTLATLRGDLGVLFARAAQLDGDAHPDLVLVVVGSAADAQLEIAVAPNVHEGSVVQLGDRAEALRDTPLLERFTLP